MAYIIRENHDDKFARTVVEFAGGYDALKAFFAKTRAYVGSSARANWLSGTPIAPEVVPTTARIVKGDLIYDWLTVRGGASLVSARFKACVEELDPARHQFFPMAVLDQRGTPQPGPFFMFNVVGYTDSIIEQKSNLKRSGRGFMAGWGYEERPGPWKCTLDSSVVGNRACWAEYRYTGTWFVSDRLAASLKQHGLLGFSLGNFCEEVSP